MSENRGLGKGIRALIPEGPPLPKKGPEEQTRILLEAIRLNQFQPRKKVDESKILELAGSIKQSGLIYPLLVRKIDKSGSDRPEYELVAGERRYRALKALGETEAPVIIKEISDQKALELSLVENLQRQDLNPLEEALAYQQLVQEFELTQEEVAAAMGKDRATISNTLRLLKLAPPVREELIQGSLSLGHARALLGIETPSIQSSLAQRIKTQGLSVRQVERLVRDLTSGSRKARASKVQDPHLKDAEVRLKRSLGTNVEIIHAPGGNLGRSGGWIRIAYYSLKDLDRLLDRLT